ncbi:MAG: TetR/AcrR family transcriptional regulator [Actinomycetia bacterium]|nr:TetR/AcrR family transcriptional regulator [Actinomycetes bacterium]
MAAKKRKRAGSDEDKALRREEILAAAKRAFAENGFHNTKISDVAEEAGFSYGTVYWYFDSKDALYDALLEWVEMSLRSAILDSLAADPSPDVEKAIRRAIAGTFEFFDADPQAVRLMFRVRGSGPGGDPAGGLYGRFAGDIEALVVDAQSDDLIGSGNPATIAFAIAALIGQFAVRRLTEDDSMSADQLAGFVVSLVLDGVRN